MLDEKILAELTLYVKEYPDMALSQVSKTAQHIDLVISESMSHVELKDFVNNHRQPKFREVLFHFIDQKGVTDATVYKKAWLDRRHFSKIRSNPHYRIGKNTVISLALALELSQTETGKLLHAAGFALSHSDTSDLVIQFCLENKIYDLQDVNEALHHLNEKPLSNLG